MNGDGNRAGKFPVLLNFNHLGDPGNDEVSDLAEPLGVTQSHANQPPSPPLPNKGRSMLPPAKRVVSNHNRSCEGLA